MTKTTILLALAFIMMSAASVNAQVRIGGMDDPNESAVLDLNATDATNDGELGLALPRVELTSTTSSSPLQAHVAGMMVYNTKTTGDVKPGTYYNDGSKWIRLESGTLIGAVDGGLTVANPLTIGDPYTVGITEGGVTTSRIADATVTAAKLNDMGADANQALVYNGTAWAPTTLSASAYGGGSPCPGAIIYNGAYAGPEYGTYDTSLGDAYDASWNSSAFTALNKDLCVAVSDVTYALWQDVQTACGSEWRLPNLMELHVMYKAMGGSGNSVTSFSVLDTNETGEGGYRSEPMHIAPYWSSTEYSSDKVYTLWVYNGSRVIGLKDAGLSYVRCVRSL